MLDFLLKKKYFFGVLVLALLLVVLSFNSRPAKPEIIAATIPEGFSNLEAADVFTGKLVNFDKEKFLLLAREKEGYLFPVTSFFFPHDDHEDALRLMSANYHLKVDPVLPAILESGKTEKEIITMASIVEGEAKGDTDRGFISGILWKRIELGIALQADAAPETYKTKGLPKNPIGNPGMKAIQAALYPESSPYLYYLHDSKGNIYYAKNFTEHQINIKKYLSR